MQWTDEKDISETTISELDSLCQKVFYHDKKKEEYESLAKEESSIIQILQRKILAHLEYSGRDKWDSKFGKVELRRKTSVKTPKTEDEKRAFFEWLRERGIFWSTVSVNSNTLNALYKSEFEASEGLTKIPGIGDPEIYTQVVLKSK